jgi:heptosyltransferase-3
MNMDTHAKHILFITASRIGDAVLSFGILDELSKRYPQARFTVVCGPLVTSLFEGFPQLEQVIPLKKQKYSKHWFDLWWQVVRTPFEMVVDLRNSIVSRTIYAKQRHIFGPHINQSVHKVEQNAQVIGAQYIPAPRLWFSEKQQQQALDLIPMGAPVLGVGPTANWTGKTWPADRFIEIIKWMTSPDGLMPNARVAVFAAPGEEEAAHHVLKSLPSERALDLIAKTDPGTAAACLARCDYYIGNDSGLMHCAAATGIPTFGLYGPSYPHLYSPWGQHTAFAATPETFDELINFKGYHSKTVGSLMTSLTVETVQAKIKEDWQSMNASLSKKNI